ncbi:YaaC family protein [Halalkalibacter kiskunsagensis]|uniref:YaaC family protein n=1 Tax=Halalkalibacter kiskunsagensis TaxID=1548599 RepID=A0ABV6KAJ1_9BACI
MDPVQNDLFIPFYSATFSRKFLTERYEENQIAQPKTTSYHTCSSFMYHLQHGQLYFKHASIVPIELKPILVFYGYVQLLKACILTLDPNYPESSQVLAHGVTTRKRKKSSYRFLDDEVKIQKNGLFSHFLDKMFHVKHQEGEKYQMLTLLRHIADMHSLFTRINKEELSYQGRMTANRVYISAKILDSYHMTANRFEQYLEANTVEVTSKRFQVSDQKGQLEITLPSSPSIWRSNPWLFNYKGEIFLLKDKEHTNSYKLPELATHFLLLYNLSMICRYEAEWWGDLIHTFDGVDYPYIAHYLTIAERKIPLLISSFLT